MKSFKNLIYFLGAIALLNSPLALAGGDDDDCDPGQAGFPFDTQIIDSASKISKQSLKSKKSTSNQVTGNQPKKSIETLLNEIRNELAVAKAKRKEIENISPEKWTEEDTKNLHNLNKKVNTLGESQNLLELQLALSLSTEQGVKKSEDNSKNNGNSSNNSKDEKKNEKNKDTNKINVELTRIQNELRESLALRTELEDKYSLTEIEQVQHASLGEHISALQAIEERLIAQLSKNSNGVSQKNLKASSSGISSVLSSLKKKPNSSSSSSSSSSSVSTSEPLKIKSFFRSEDYSRILFDTSIVTPKTRDSLMTQAIGLPNLGNTCFANSAHQLLFQIPGLDGLFKSSASNEQNTKHHNEDEHKSNQSSGSKAEDELRGAINRLYTRLQSNRHFFKEPEVLEDLATPSRGIFNALEVAALTTGTNKSLSERLSAGRVKMVNGQTRRGIVGEVQLDANEYLELLLKLAGFGKTFGHVALREAHGQTLPTLDESLLPVHVPNAEKDDGTAFSLQELFDERLRPVMGNWNGKVVELEPEYVFEYDRDHSKFPLNYVILNLTRARYGTPVQIDENQFLNLNLYRHEMVSKASSVSTPVSLAPSAVICRRGASVDSGHYIVYTYNREEKAWYLHDDRRAVVKLAGDQLKAAKQEMALGATTVLLTRVE